VPRTLVWSLYALNVLIWSSTWVPVQLIPNVIGTRRAGAPVA
jgi:hypothetical protein